MDGSAAPAIVGANAKLTVPVMSAEYAWANVTWTGICVAPLAELGTPVRLMPGTGGSAMYSERPLTEAPILVLSVTRATTLNGLLGVLAAVGVPLITPVLESSVNPLGKPAAVQVY